MAEKQKTIALAGASGVVGRRIMELALQEGLRVLQLTRGFHHVENIPDSVERIVWNPGRAALGEEEAAADIAAALEGTDALINLAGSNVARGRFTESVKKDILESRIRSVHALRAGLQRCSRPPPVYLQASAVGYYGNTGDAEVAEDHGPGAMYLSRVCIEWEAAAAELRDALRGMRIILARIGLVLDPESPAWKKMILPIKMGVGGTLGGGDQWYPWIDSVDLARAALFLIRGEETSGAYNFTAPHPIRQRDLVSQVASRLNRPAFFPLPASLLRIMLGEMADEMVLSSCKAFPVRLQEAGFEFRQNTFDEELKVLL